ncbi:MAG: grpE [Acidimicrobiales bacterium]|nr:grpE [Acidimicrobiales bacterium]
MSPEETPDVPTGEPEGSPVEAAVEEETPLTVEDLLAELEAVVAQRDEYLALAQAKQAEFENFRKRMMKQQTEEVARAASKLVIALLPVLDAFDYGVAHGDESLAPMRAQLLGALEREGLARLDPTGEAFDPNEHEAVAHEPGDGGEPVVAESLRAGYRWQGHLLRPVMVRVRD